MHVFYLINEVYMSYIELNGAEIDVLYKLYRYGSQDDGDLPSKAGMVDLINKGLAIKDYEAVFEKANRLTQKGYDVAYNRLHNTINEKSK